MPQKYDAIIIGAGMSGLAAGIRLAMFDKKVCILEQHFIPGGLNSYYKRGDFQFDVGLHAMTNFCNAGEKGKPLGKLFKQLRIPYSSFKLNQQKQSQILFDEQNINFNNDSNYLKQEIAEKFPQEIDNYCRLLKIIENFNETALTGQYQSAKEIVRSYILDPLLVEMLFCPLLIYGSAWENDMDFAQFVIMFKSIFLEGFARPQGGVRTVINAMTNRLAEVGGEICYRKKIKKILCQNGQTYGVELDDGSVIEADSIFSSAGLPETMNLLNHSCSDYPIGKLSFTETIALFDKKPTTDSTIIFYNQGNKYNYRKPDTLFDPSSAVICFPNNFEVDDYDYGIIRLTNMANFEMWDKLDPVQYKESKKEVEHNAAITIKKLFPNFQAKQLFSDTFTPITIKKFTGHFNGTVYGSTRKSKDGTTPIKGLYICGTDQGFLGIVGSILSGISMANLHGLMK